MPMHDWSRVPAGLFHHFHQHWSIEIAATLNRGRLPKGVAALVEQRSGPKESDVLAIESRGRPRPGFNDDPAIATMTPPVTRFVSRTTKQIYATRANLIVLKHHLGRTIAVIEIVSPVKKDSRAALRDLVDKTIEFLRAGIHVLAIDLFPPTPRDPLGIHKVIWDEIEEKDFALPAGKDRILASYETGGVQLLKATSSRSESVTAYRICRCSWRTTGTYRFRWNRRTRQPGTRAPKNFVWRSKPA